MSACLGGIEPWPRCYKLEWGEPVAHFWGSLVKQEGLERWRQSWEPDQNWETELELKKPWMVYHGSAEEAREEPGSWVWLLR